MSENPNATRMELIKVKLRIQLANKGHKLLKQKRDFLVMEFLSLLGEMKDLRRQFNEQMKKSFTSLAVAQSYHSIFELERQALFINEVKSVSIGKRNVMGVKIPVIKKFSPEREIGERGYSIIGSSAKIDAVSSDFEKALDLIIQIAESEISIKKLLTEIEKTKRRVNALEYSIIPGLEDQMRDISFRIDEMERDNFVTLKTLKEILNTQVDSL